MYRSEDILEGAHSIRVYLRDLLGEEAESVDSELTELLNQAQRGGQVDLLILRILASRNPTREWLEKYLKDKYTQQEQKSDLRSYDPLPGKVSALPSTLYRCPQGDFEWHRHSVGIPVPECPTHHIPIVPVQED